MMLVVARSFRPVGCDQRFLLPPDMSEWLPADHEVWFVMRLVDSLDVSGLEREYDLGGVGRRAYDPKMMLGVLVYAYSRGVLSSRAIERACWEQVPFRVLCGGDVPDHTTIARFVQRHEAWFKELFVEVLARCAQLGLVSLGLVAVDGTKIAANASLSANRMEATLRSEIDGLVAKARELDEQEDEQFGDGRGDEVPGELVGERLEARLEALARIETRAETSPRSQNPQVNLTGPDSRIMSSGGGYLQGYNAQIVAAAGGIIVGADVSDATSDYGLLWPMLDTVTETLTAAGIDEKPVRVVADAGYYSTENVTKRVDGPDLLIATAKRHKQRRRRGSDAVARWQADQDRIAAAVAAEQQRRAEVFSRTRWLVDAAAVLGLSVPQVSVSRRQWQAGGAEAIKVRPPKGRVARPLPEAVVRAAMDAKLADPANQARYKQRGHLAETPFANIKHARGLRRFRRRGLPAVRAEWHLATAVHNAIRLRTKLSVAN